MRTRLSALLLLLIAFLAAGCGPTQQTAAPAGQFTTISVADLKTRLAQDTTLLVLDVRTPEEYTQDGHIAGSLLMPLSDVPQRMNELDKDQPIACFCRSGNRSRAACEQLASNGFSKLVNVDGGITAWRAAGYPVE